MINTQQITVLEDVKVVLIVPQGISSEQRALFSRFNPEIKKIDGSSITTYKYGVCETTNMSLLDHFEGYKKISLVKNPYWRVLDVYFWKFFYGGIATELELPTFKRVLKKFMLDDTKLGYFEPQVTDTISNFIRCENFREDFWYHFQIDCGTEARYMFRISDSNSVYDRSLPTFSHFYDQESADIVYEKHQKIFKDFNYDYYSYLDYLNPIDKIHHIHGKPTNKFEQESIY